MEKLLTTLSAVGFVLVLVGIIYGTYANEYWKLHKGSEKYAGGFKRAILGIAGWVAIICLMCHQFGAMVVGLLISAALLALTGMAMQKDGIQAGKYILLVFFASLGTYARLLLSWTIIGLWPKNQLVRAAQVGWERAAAETIESWGRQSAGTSTSIDVESDSVGGDGFAFPSSFVTRSGETFRLQNDSGDNATYYCPRTGETVHLRDTDFGRYD